MLSIKILIVLLFIVCINLCGCSEVNFVTYQDNNGAIQEFVYLTIDEQSLINYGLNPATIKLEIKTDAYQRATALVNTYKTKINQQFTNQTTSSEEYDQLIKGVSVIEQNWNDSNVYIIGLQYENPTIYKTYYESMNGTTFNKNIKTVKKLFYTKIYQYGTANYGDYSIFNEIYDYYSNSKFTQISPQQNTLTYTYAVDSRRIHSDADKIIIDSNGKYLHSWNVDPNEPAREICFYTIKANKWIWILTCVIIGLTTCIMLSIIAIIKYNKNKSINSKPENILNN